MVSGILEYELTIFFQEKFLDGRRMYSNQTWYIPIDVVNSKNNSFENTQSTFWLVDKEVIVADLFQLEEETWPMINKQWTGFYRVNYEENIWYDIIKTMKNDHKSIHPMNRAQLIDDAFALVFADRLHAMILYYLIDACKQERDFMVLSLIFERDHKNNDFNRVPLTYVKIFISEMSAAIHSELEREEDIDKTEEDKILFDENRKKATEWACKWGGIDCVEEENYFYIPK